MELSVFGTKVVIVMDDYKQRLRKKNNNIPLR